MSKRKWGYVINISNFDEETMENKTIAFMEAIAISPYSLDAGNRLNFGSLSESDELAISASPMMMGAFIQNLGDQNTLSLKKLSDLTSIDLLNAQINKTTFSYADLAVTSLSKISSKLHGVNRLRQIYQRADTYVTIANVSVTFAWTKINEKEKPFYDLITLTGVVNVNILKSR